MKTGKLMLCFFSVVLAVICSLPVIAGARDFPGLTISRLVVGENIENREPVGVADTFSLSVGTVYCYLEARDIDADAEVHFVWMHEGVEVANVPLTLRKGNRWRTYSSKKLGDRKGAWKVELRDAENLELKSVEFVVE